MTTDHGKGTQASHASSRTPRRLLLYRFIEEHRWILPLPSVVTGVTLIVLSSRDSRPLWVWLTALLMTATGFIWGYGTRALKRMYPRWPRLQHFRRREYASVWDTLSLSRNLASEAATGFSDEKTIRGRGQEIVDSLIELAQIGSDDAVLEIGCGIGRVGLMLAPHCQSWTGADISSNMLAHAAARLGDLANIRLVRLSTVGLGEFADQSFDVVYSTNVFAHLEHADRWRYVQEAFRVLHLGGRLCIDNVDLEGDAGWAGFSRDLSTTRHEESTPYAPRPSTAAELTTYLRRAGFGKISAHHRPPLVIATGIKLNEQNR